MLLIVSYLLFLSAFYVAALGVLIVGQGATWLEPLRVGLTCAAVGGLGGCVYCLRGVYLNVAVRKQWNREWYVWYFLRPIVSAGCGAVSDLFLRAGFLPTTS